MEKEERRRPHKGKMEGKMRKKIGKIRRENGRERLVNRERGRERKKREINRMGREKRKYSDQWGDRKREGVRRRERR